MADAVFRGRAERVPMMGGLVLSIVLILTACSSGDDGLDESAASESASETSVDFGGDADDEATGGESTDADEVEDSEDTDGADETEASSESPSEADDDEAAIEAEIEQVIQRNWEIWVQCTTDPESCDPAAALAETESTSSQFYMESVGVVQLWKQQGIAYRPVEGRAVDRFVEIQSIDVAPDLTSAEVLLCDRDDRAQFQQTAGGDYEMVEGTDIGEDLLLRRVVALDGGEWKIVENELLDRRHVEEGIDPLC